MGGNHKDTGKLLLRYPTGSGKEKNSDLVNQTNFYQQKETKINCIYYVTDYMKLVIENGKEFKIENLYSLIDSMIVEELSDGGKVALLKAYSH